MIVRYKNAGAYLPYSLEGTRLTLGDGALTIDLVGSARDWPVCLDICADLNGALVLGLSRRYVAQLQIPARAYTIEKGAADNLGFEQLIKRPAPFDASRVVLTLWALEVS